RRSASESPPHTPEVWHVPMDHSRHWRRTSQRPHTAFAASIWEAAGPVVPTGKNSSGSSSLHNARCTQSISVSPLWAWPMGSAFLDPPTEAICPERGREYTDATSLVAMVPTEFPQSSSPLVVAHRGASAELP